LSDLYLGAIIMVNNPSFPGRVRFVAHAMREICNRLPDKVAGLIVGERPDYKTDLDNIASVWDREVVVPPRSVDGQTAARSGITGDTEVRLPRRLLMMIERLIRRHQAVRETKKQKARRMFQALVPETAKTPYSLAASVGLWYQFTKGLEALAHESVEGLRDNDVAVLESKFQQFEALLTSILAPFFVAVDELDEILEDANT